MGVAEIRERSHLKIEENIAVCGRSERGQGRRKLEGELLKMETSLACV